MKRILIFALFLLLIDTAIAATIHGTVYDLSLEPMVNAVVEVDSTPQQRFVAKNGVYSFELPNGNYSITAASNSYFAEENISVKEAGDYVLDLFLFPGLEEEESLEADIDIDESYFEKKSYIYYYLIAAVILLFLFVLFFIRKSKKILEKIKPVEADELKKIIDFIKKSGGRTTQKDIRKEFPLSEAKISLMISELEEKGIIKKIKKGRGNIIILNK